MKNKLNILLINQSIGDFFNEIIIRAFRKYNLTIFSGTNFIKINNALKHVKAKSYNNKSILTRFITWSLFTLELIKFIFLNGNKYDKTLIVSNPPFSIFLGILLRKNSFSLLIYDLYPEIIINKYKKLSNKYPIKFLLRIWKNLNFISFRKSKYIFCLSDQMGNLIKTYSSNFESTSKIKVVNPWYSSKLKNYAFKKNNFFKEKYKDNGRLLISYSGNIGISHPIELIIEGINKFKDVAKFIIISKGIRFEELKKKANRLGINKNDLHFLNPLNEKIFFESLEAVDLSIVALDSFASKESIPSKTFNSLFFGKPILGLSYCNSSLERLINKYECGFNVEPEFKNINFLKNKLNDLNQNYSYLNNLSNNAKNASKNFTPENANEFINYFLDQ